MGCGCGEPKSNMIKYVCGKCGKEEMREAQAGEEVKSCCGEKMVRKEEFIEKMDKQLKEWGAQIDLLKVKAGKGSAEIKIAIDKEVVVLNKMMKDAQKRLQEISGKSGEAWKSLSQGINKAGADLKEAMRQAAEKFN